MRYKGYVGLPGVDTEAGVIRGKVIDVMDTITFQGRTVEEAEAAFRESVDDYLEFCASLGREPEKPFSGKLLVRVPPAVHRTLSAAAQVKGVSLNRLVSGQLKRLARIAAETGPNPPKAVGKSKAKDGAKSKAKAKRKVKAG